MEYKLNIKVLDWKRIEKGLSITQLAKESHVAKATISRILRGESTARPYTVGKIAAALGCSVQELFFED